ncbi:MAG TPA: hypothetical protein VJ303_13225, partial [Steroidobacteraceae bacterium]|nr:hypothetical protein [Steroidobacteraceae bacterium]
MAQRHDRSVRCFQDDGEPLRRRGRKEISLARIAKEEGEIYDQILVTEFFSYLGDLGDLGESISFF